MANAISNPCPAIPRQGSAGILPANLWGPAYPRPRFRPPRRNASNARRHAQIHPPPNERSQPVNPDIGRPTAARWAVSATFFINGAVFASWVPHIPEVKLRLGLSDGALGVALLAVALGAIVAMPLSGWLSSRWGSRRVTRLAAAGFCFVLPWPLYAPNLPVLFSVLLLFGFFNSGMDVAMNAQGLSVERRWGKPILSSFHGLWSVGGLAGAGTAAGLIALGVGSRTHLLLFAALFLLAVQAAGQFLLPAQEDAANREPVFVKPIRALAGLGILALFALVGEGAMADWTAVYLRTVLETDAGTAALGFAAFSLTMAAGRFAGDWLVERVGPRPVLRTGGMLVAVGLACGLAVSNPWAAIAGFGCVGLGLSNSVPILFSAAGRTPGVGPGLGIASVATMGYLGFLAGPPVIGFAADLVGLRWALGLVAAYGLLIAVFAQAVNRNTPKTEP